MMKDARESPHTLRRGRTALAHGPKSICATEDIICAVVMIIMHLSSRMSMGAAMTGAAPCIRVAAIGRDNRQGQPVSPYYRACFLDEEGRGGMQARMPAIESMSTDRMPSVSRNLNTSCWLNSSRRSRRDTTCKTTTIPPTTMGVRARQQRPLQQALSQWEHAAMALAKSLFATQFPLERISFMAQTRPHALRHAASTANTISTTPTMTNTAMTTATVTTQGMIATGVDTKQQHDPPPARSRLPTDGGELIAQQDRSKCRRYPQQRVANTDSRARPIPKTAVEVKQSQEASPSRGGIAADFRLTHAPHGRPAGGFCARRGPVSAAARTTTTTTQLAAPTQTTEATVRVQEPSDTPPARRHATGDSGLTAARHEDCWVGLLPPPGASVASTTSMESCAAPSRTPRAQDGLFAMCLPRFLSGCIFLVAQMPSCRALKRKSVCHRKQPQPPRRLQCALFVVMVAVGCFVVTVERTDTVSATTTTTQDQQHALSVAPSWDEISAAVHKCFAEDEHEVCHMVIRTDEQSLSSTSAIGHDDSGDFVPIHIPRPYHIHLLSATAPSTTTICNLNDPNGARAASSFFALDDGARLSFDAKIEAMFAQWQSVVAIARLHSAGAERRLLPSLASVAHVFALYEATCSIQAPPTSDLRCWGVNSVGQLGQGDTISRGSSQWQMGANLSAVNLGTGLTPRFNVTTTSLGEHVCLVLDPTGLVKCFGYGPFGQLGYGDTAHRGDNPGELGDTLPAVDLGSSLPPILQLVQGRYHSCVLFAHNLRFKCWGWNLYGQLGYEDGNYRGDGPGDMGDSLPFVDLGTGLGALDLFAGAWHTCARVNDTRQGGLKCWGDNFLGQLGYGDKNSRGDDPFEMSDSLPLVSVSSSGHVHVTQGDGASRHTCVLLNDSAVKCFGNGGSGQLGYEDIAVRGDEPGEMGDSLPAVDLLGSATGVYVTHVHCGSAHSCALISDGSMKCWGFGGYGQLGHEDSYDIGDDVGDMGDSLPAVRLGANDVISASLGRWHTCAHLNDSSVKCFGKNQYGQLGQGDTDDRGDNVGEMGSALPVVDIGPVITAVPTFAPSVSPPTAAPSVAPTLAPTMAPTLSIATEC